MKKLKVSGIGITWYNIKKNDINNLYIIYIIYNI